jgi:hypothetical protein
MITFERIQPALNLEIKWSRCHFANELTEEQRRFIVHSIYKYEKEAKLVWYICTVENCSLYACRKNFIHPATDFTYELN